jgi:DNA (cytosine-5)-methyltransferase 1
MKRQDWETCNIVAHTLRGEGFDAGEDGTGRGTPLVPIAFHPTQDPIWSDDGSTHAMGTGSGGGCATIAVAFSCKDYGADATNDISPTLRSMGHADSHANGGGQVAVAFTASAQANSYAWERDVYPTLLAQAPNDSSNIQQGVRQGMAVRRLTPRECERLQGFPDDYTLLGDKTPDGPRYKALGNSMAVPVMRWIGERIAKVSSI